MTTARLSLIYEYAHVAARLGLAAVFLAACIHKIADPGAFALQVATYQILPLGLINLQAIILPWLELMAAASLVLGLWTRAGALVTCGMNVMFIVAIAMALAAGLQLQCGCFASAETSSQIDSGLIVRDALLLAVGIILTLTPPDRFSLDHLLNKRRKP